MSAVRDRQKFYLTFGVKYAATPHPAGSWVTPNGVVEVLAESYQEARALVVATFGIRWSMLYPAAEHIPSRAHFPAGVIAVLDTDGLVTV